MLFQTIGNHEFDAGINALTTFLQNVTFPVVSANIDANEEPAFAVLFTKSTVLNVSGEQIGIVGYTTPQTNVTTDPGNDINFSGRCVGEIVLRNCRERSENCSRSSSVESLNMSNQGVELKKVIHPCCVCFTERPN